MRCPGHTLRPTPRVYAGMLPGCVAGHYDYDDVHIDLGRLAQFAKARFIRAEVIGMECGERRLLLRDRPALHYAWCRSTSAPRRRLMPCPVQEMVDGRLRTQGDALAPITLTD